MKFKILICPLLITALISCGSAVRKNPESGVVEIQWVDDLSGDFLFKDNWSYPEGIFMNEFGQLVCDGFCPSGAENMRDENGRIFADSVESYYKLVDTTQLFHSIKSEAETYEWAGTDFITVKRINKDTVNCFTLNNASTHSSLNLKITGGTVMPTIVLKSIASFDATIYYCSGGEMIIDKNLWKEGVLKASFDFNFIDSGNPDKPMYWKGHIYADILEETTPLNEQNCIQEFLHNEISLTEDPVQKIQKMIDEINVMSLLIDTISERFFYFDKQGQLRKYFYKYELESERGKTITYYDEKGNLIYYDYDGGPSCEDHIQNYFINEGSIVDGNYHYKCFCCENEDGTLQKVDTIWRITNANFAESVDWWEKNYLCADSLLDFITSVESSGSISAEYFFLPGTISRQKENQYTGSYHIRSYEELKSLEVSFIIFDSIDNPKTYFLQYPPKRGNVNTLKYADKHAVFLLFPSFGESDEYSIERMNIDGIGSDELIIRNRNVDERYSKQISDMVVWDLDSRNCLFYISNRYVSQNVNNEFVVNLNEGQMSIQKVKDGIPGLTYKYKFVESGFKLDRVE